MRLQKGYLTFEEFKKAQDNVELAYTLVKMTKEYLENNYCNEECTCDITSVLECIEEKLSVVCVDFTETDV